MVSPKHRGKTLKGDSINSRVTKFDTSVLRFMRKIKPTEEKLVQFVRDEWLKATHSYLPATTAKKIAKRLQSVNVTMTTLARRGKTSKKQRGGFLTGAPITAMSMTPGVAATPLLTTAPLDILQSAFSIAQDRSCGSDEFAGYGPKPGMGDNRVGRSRSRKQRQRGSNERQRGGSSATYATVSERQRGGSSATYATVSERQRGGAAFSIPSSVPANIQTMGTNSMIGVQNQITANGNPVVPGFQQLYTPLNGFIDDQAMRINSQLPIVFKVTT
jgi:hypothetical protein